MGVMEVFQDVYLGVEILFELLVETVDVDRLDGDEAWGILLSKIVSMRWNVAR